MINESMFCAIRRNPEGKEWFDPDTLSGDREWCEIQATNSNDTLQQWAKDNPVVRYTRVAIIELA